MTKQKKDLYDKIVSTVLILSLVINQSFYPVFVLADETQADVEQEEVVSPVPDEESQPENNSEEQGDQAGAENETTPPAPIESGQADEPTSQMQTGDADSASQTDTTVNYTESQVPGEISAEGCDVEGQVGCPIDETKIATTSAQTDSTSISGQNTISQEEGTASLETGDATANSTSDSLVNTNIIEATGSAEAEGEEGSETDQNNENSENSISLVNQADHQASSSAESVSGQNEASADQVQMDTGDSIASANQVNLVNTNIIGSEFEFFIFDIYDENGDINLNELWKKLQLELGSSSIASVFLSPDNKLVILINNKGDVEVTGEATAISGQNQAQGQTSSQVETGNSIALANIFNLINTNIVGAGFLFGVINIFGDFTGNIIVPSLERFEEGDLVLPFSFDETQISSQNQAYIDCLATSAAISGENKQEGVDLTMETGNALSKSACINYLNLNLFLSDWYLLFMNNFGVWDGQVLSWQNPESQAYQDDPSGQYANGQNGNGESNNGDLMAAQNGEGAIINLENWAKIKAKARATAISGQNESQGFLSSLMTGTSIALANIFNFINLNIIGGRFFMPIINLFGRWTGNLIFAYPDMAIDISVDKKDVQLGDTVLYTVTYENKGYEDARDVKIELFLPGEEVVPPSPLLAPNGGENSFIFQVGDVKRFEGGSFQFYAVVANGHLEARIEKKGLLAWVGSLIPKASAAENGRTLTTTAKVGTSDTESDISNNTASTTKYLALKDEGFEITGTVETNQLNQENQEVSYGTPNLEVSSSHNVGEYVYPGDIVTFSVSVKNIGSGNSKDTVIYQSIFDGGSPLAVNQFKIGDVAPGLSKKITFGLKIPADVPEGTYNSLIFAEGLSENQELVYSNDSLTQFNVKSLFGLVKSAQAQEDKEEVISKQDQVGCQKDYLPYILSLLLAILWFSEMIKRRRLEKELEEVLEKIKNKGKKSS